MINFAELTWVVDTKEMTCREEKNRIVVKIIKDDKMEGKMDGKTDGKMYRGQIQNMPVGLFAEIAKCRNGEKIIERIVKKAEHEFLSACVKKNE